MAKYHVIADIKDARTKPPWPANQIVATYKNYADPKETNFRELVQFENGKPTWQLTNCAGTIILIDNMRDETKKPLNKLHFGAQLHRPHAESATHHGIEGFRIDLAMLDTHYADALLKELLLWRNPEHRNSLRKKYEHKLANPPAKGRDAAYYIQPRLAQLDISENGLELKIQELQRQMAWLRSPDMHDMRRFVYGNIIPLERSCYDLIIHLNYAASVVPPIKRIKYVESSELFPKAEKVKRGMLRVLDFIADRVEPETARNYWKTVFEWRDL